MPLDLLHAQDDQVAQAAQEVRTLEARLSGFYESAAKGKLSPDGLERIEASLLPQLAAAKTRATPRRVPSTVTELAGRRDVEARWSAMPITAKREVVRTLVKVRILPAKQGSKVFDPATVEVTPA